MPRRSPLARGDAPNERTELLVVENDRQGREALAELLHHRGYLVREAADPDEARALLAARVPDVVILDLGFPKGGGLDLAREILAAGTRRPPTIIAYSGYDRLAAEARDAGCLFVLKPGIDELLSTIGLAAAERATPPLGRPLAS